MKWVLFLAVFFLALGAFLIISNHNLHLGVKEEISIFYGWYYHWLTSLVSQGEHITGYALKLDWLPTNTTDLNRTLE